jgi:outer membrane protein OmpA-like peptidoglycan-associated protein
MRILLIILLLPLAASTPAQAQVTTNDKALDSLAKAPPSAEPLPAPAKAEPTSRHTARHAARHAPHPTAPAKKTLPAVPIPASPPPNPVIQPLPFVMPAHKPLPPPPVPVKQDAVGAATQVDGATRITFGPASSDLNPGTVAAIQKIADDAKANPVMEIGVTGWAPGTAEDPSTPRRLSLDRVLAARAVLINAGIVSNRIHAIAKGFTDIGTAPPDRVDVSEILPPLPKPATPASPPTQAPPPK